MTGGADIAQDGVVHDRARSADVLAIQDLATSYAYAVDDRDWQRFEALFLPDAQIDYLGAGGIAGIPAEIAAWMSGALAVFEVCLHTTAAHQIRFTAPDCATGRVQVVNRNGARWNGEPQIVDIAAVYEDAYQRVGGHWKIASRTEHTLFITGGELADLIRDLAASTALDRPGPFR